MRTFAFQAFIDMYKCGQTCETVREIAQYQTDELIKGNHICNGAHSFAVLVKLPKHPKGVHYEKVLNF